MAYHADPDTMLPVLDRSGPWTDPVDPIAKASAIEEIALRRDLMRKHNLPESPKPWRLPLLPTDES